MANEFVARNGLIAQDNSNITGSLKVTSKISIGTDYAGFPLNVAGVAYIIGGSVWVNDGYGLVNATSTNTGIYPDSTHNITIKNNNSSNVYIKSDGNVGIGTTSPAQTFHIYGSSASPLIVERSTANSNTGIRYKNATTSWYTGLTSIDSFGISYNDPNLATALFQITPAGNVGIGTTSPSSRLAVSGSIQAYLADAQGTVSITVGEGTTGATGNTIALETNTTTNTTRIYNTGTSTSLNIGSTGTNSDVILSSRKDVYLKVNNAADVFAGTTAMFISSSGFIGIGKTNPSYTLDINGSFSSTTSGVAIVYNSGVLYHGNYYQFTSGNNYVLYARGGGDLLLGSNDSETIRAASSGNVGIGSTSPGAKLDVNGNVRALSFTGSFSGSAAAPGANTQVIFNSSGSLAASSSFIFNGANVGIGTTTLSQRLSIGSADSDAIIINVGGRLYFRDTSTSIFEGGGLNLIAGSSRPMIFSADGSERMRIALGGNVGIGTTAPSQKLTIYGGTATGQIKMGFSDTANWEFGRDNSVTGDLIFTNNLAGIAYERIRVKQGTGDIGIGSTAPITKLDVVGGIRTTTGLTVTGSVAVQLGSGFTGFIDANANAFVIRHSSSGTHITMNNSNSTVLSQIVTANNSLNVTPGGNSTTLGLSITSGSYPAATLLSVGSNVLIVTGSSVGIGTTAPLNRLHIYNSVTGSGIERTTAVDVLTLESENTTAVEYDGFGQIINFRGVTYNDSTKRNLGRIIHKIRDASGGATPNGTSLHFELLPNSTASVPVERVVFDYTGNVGIGSAAPGAKLDVNGNVRALSFTGSFSGSSAAPGANTQIVYNSLGSLAASSGFIFDGTNVGIGTSSPVNKIQANYNPVGIDLLTATAGTGSTNWNRNAGLMITAASLSNALALGASGTANDRKAWIQVGHPDTAAQSLGILALNPLGGNVGIGTSAPTGSLQVNGIISISGNNVIGQGSTYGTTGAANFATLKIYDSATGNTILNNQGYGIQIQTAGSDKVTILNNGNVGIGTTAPSTKFEINTPTSGYTGFTGGSSVARFNALAGSGPATALLLTNYVGDLNTDTTVDIDFAAVDSNSVLGAYPHARIGYTGLYNPGINIVNEYEARGYFRIATRTEGSGGILTDKMVVDYLGNTLFLSGSVGIGTTSPGTTLDVNGNVRAQSFTGSFSGSAAAPGANTQVIFNSSGSLAASSGFVFTGASVGIGTTTPLHPLDVTSAGNTILYIRAGSTTSLSRLVFGTSTNADRGFIDYDNTAASRNMSFKIAETERVRIDSNGNVGIGSTSPGAKLDVSGSSRFGGNTVISGSFEVTRPAATQTAGDLLVDSLNSTIYIGKLDSGAGNTTTIFRDRLGTVKARYENAGSGLIGFGNFGTNYGVSITSYSPQTGTIPARLLVDSGANTFPAALFLSGSVGIGTTTPSASLDVSGFGRFTNGLQVTGSFVATSMTASSLLVNGIITAQTLVVSTVSSSVVYSSGSNIFGNSLTNVQQFTGSLRVTGSGNHWIMGGNVGVDINAPLYKLDVNGTIRSKSGTTGSLYLGETTGGTTYVAAALIGTPSTTYNPVGRLSIQIPTHGVGTDYGLTEQMSIQVPAADSKAATMVLLPFGGNVGIGSTAPGTTLDVVGNVRAQSFTGSFSGSAAAPGSNTNIIYNNSGVLAGSNSFVFNGTNVGIGTTSPSTAKLVIFQTGGTQLNLISGDAFGSADVVLRLTSAGDHRGRGVWMDNSATVGSWYAGVPYTGGSYSIGYHITQPEYIANSKLLISTTGNVAINSTVTNYKFQVNTGISSSQAYGISIQQGTNGANKDAAAFGIAVQNSGASTNAADLFFATATGGSLSERMRITSGGSVGIGTTSPGAWLQVGNSSDGRTGLIVRGGDGGAGTIIADFLNSSGNSVMEIQGNGNVGIGTTSPVATLEVIGNIKAQSFTGSFSGSVAAAGSNTNIIYNNSGVLAGSNDFVYDGTDLGIGTTSPAVYINGGFAKGIQISNNGRAGIRFHDTSGVVQNFDIGVHSGFAYISAVYSQTPSIKYQAVSNHIFENNDTASVYITNTNRVGIGTTTPAQALHVSTATNYQGILINGSNAPAIGFAKTSTTTPEWKVGVSGNNGQAFSISTGAANTDLFFITSSGGVGIGTTTVVSGARLHVNGYATTPNNTGWCGLNSAGALVQLLVLDSANKTQIGTTTSATVMTLTGTSVGIGTVSPATRLDVSGSVALAGTDGLRIGAIGDNTSYDNVKLFYSGYNAGSPRVYLTPRTTPGSGIVETYFHLLNTGGSSTTSNNTMGLLVDGNTAIGGVGTINARLHVSSSTGGVFRLDGVNGSAILYASASGNIGIGTTSPAYKLDVNGTLGVTGASVFGSTMQIAGNGIKLNFFNSGYENWYLGTKVNTTQFVIGSATNSEILTFVNSGAATFSSSVTAVSFIETSTKKKKDNIKSYSTDVNKFKQLEPVTFNWKDTGKSDVGLIAEAVDELFPEFVSKTDEGEVTGINYGKLTTILINIVKQQQERIEKLEQQINK